MDAWNGIDRLPKSELQAMQNGRLHDFLNNHLYPFSPYYRDLLDKHKVDVSKIKTVRDLRHLPFSNKASLMNSDEHPQRSLDFILQPSPDLIKKHWPLGRKLGLFAKTLFKGEEAVKADLALEYRPIFLTATTGRTYEPVSFVYTDYDIRNLRITGSRMLDVFGVQEGQKAVSLFPYAPHLAFWAVTFGALNSGILAVSTGGGKVMGTKGNIGFIQRLKPHLLAGIPGYTYHLLRTAEAQGADFSSVEMMALGAEKLAPGMKDRMRGLLESMGARAPRIHGTYGFTEAKMAWGEYVTDDGQSSGYYTYPDMEVFEIVDPDTGEPVGDGEPGEIVYTSINHRGSVVLRYRTGDLARGGMTWEPCPFTGKTVPRISTDITRVSNIKEVNLSKIKGTLVNLNSLSYLMSNTREVEEWQAEIRKKNDDPLEMDELVIHLSVRDDVDRKAFEQKLKTNIAEDIEVKPNAIEFHSLDEMLKKLGMETELKEKRIVDSRPS